MKASTNARYVNVHRAMKQVLATESYEYPLSDAHLCDLIQAHGVYCTRVIARDVRLYFGIPERLVRRDNLFAKQHDA